MKTPQDRRVALLLEIIDHAYAGRSWNGATLRGALRGVSAKDAAWRPGRGRHSIWEYVLHCAWWKHTVRRRISGGDSGAFARSPANFPAVPKAADTRAWRADIALLDVEHKALRAAVASLKPAMLPKPTPKKQWLHAQEIHGIAAHDYYHTGQIQLIRRLLSASRS